MAEKKYQDPLFDLQYKEKLDYQYILNLQILRCLQSSGTVFFPGNVELLLRMIPTASKAMIATRGNEWNPIIRDFDYHFCGPIKLGTKKKPLMAKIGHTRKRYPIPYIENEDGEREIDWDDPNIISPQLVDKEAPDHMALFNLIQEELESVKLSWNQDTETFKIATISLPLSKKPTPYIPEKTEEDEDVEEEEP